MTALVQNIDILNFIPLLLWWGASSPRRTRNTSQFSATSDSFTASTPRRDQAKFEMQSRHLVLGRPIGHLSLGVGSRTYLEMELFQLLSNIHDHWPWVRIGTKIDLKTASFACMKALFCDHRAIKLTQTCVCFTNPCINLFVPSSVTRECHPEVLELKASNT